MVSAFFSILGTTFAHPVEVCVRGWYAGWHILHFAAKRSAGGDSDSGTGCCLWQPVVRRVMTIKDAAKQNTVVIFLLIFTISHSEIQFFRYAMDRVIKSDLG